MTEIKFYKKGLEQYPKSNIIFGNLLIIFWIALGTIACWFLNPLTAWIYLGFAILMVGFILRKLLCVNCYYYNKLCCMGWGECTAILFKKGNIKKFNNSIGQKLAPITYGLLSAIPVIFIVTSMFKEFSISKLIVLVLLLSVSFYSGTINRKKTCAKCKMRLICKGCAIKEKNKK